ncbi:MAG: HAD family hydrolase [Candidatus Riflebacteria bacterium]|nr:HAD family hydrolase [Candidatus Riflebacteria bacterium]
MTTRPRAIFLDRDGTLNPDPGYISRPEDFCLFPGVGENLLRLRNAGYLLILVTNQSGIARGLILPQSLCEIHSKLQTELGTVGAGFDRIYVCPHHPDFPRWGKSECDCRKPASGLVLRAIADLDIDPARSFVIGDRKSDVRMGLAAGVFPILIGRKPEEEIEPGRYHLASTLESAVDWILSRN